MRTLLLLFFTVPLAAQSSLPDLAADVCACVQRELTDTLQVGVRATARGCMTKLVESNGGIKAAFFDPVATPSVNYDRLADLLIDHLTDDCPFLQTLRPAGEAEFRWSDRPAEAPPRPRFIAPKNPPPGEATAFVGPAEFLLKGIYLGVSPDGAVAIQTKDGVRELPVLDGRAERAGVGEEVVLRCGYGMVERRLVVGFLGWG